MLSSLSMRSTRLSRTRLPTPTRLLNRNLLLHAQWRGDARPQPGAPPPLVIMHGLFGSSSNFNTPGRQLSKRRPVLLLDLRNHGASPWSDDCSLEAMADDLMETLDEHKIDHQSGAQVGRWEATGQGLADQAALLGSGADLSRVPRSCADPGWAQAPPLHT